MEVQMNEVRVRFAPSPTGRLHVGVARTALYNFLFARHHHGAFLLRIEDTDRQRSTAAFEDDVIDSLNWLKLAWDEPLLRQSERLHAYRIVAERLQKSGRAYRCFCSHAELEEKRREAEKRGGSWVYDGTCRNLSEQDVGEKLARGEPHTLRLAIPDGPTSFSDLVFGEVTVENQEFGDFVILRADGSPVYHLAVVVDDLEMGISHVIRGVDHLGNTPKHIQLYTALGVAPPMYAHLPMVLGPDKQKLSKRHTTQPGMKHFIAHLVGDFQERGYLPEAMVNFMALLGWSPGDDREIMGTEELIESFSLERVNRSNAVFDPEKLAWMNGHYIRNLPPARFEQLATPYLERNFVEHSMDLKDHTYVSDVLSLIQERIRVLSEVGEAAAPFFGDLSAIEEKAFRKHLTKSGASDILGRLKAVWQDLPCFTVDAVEESLRQLADELDVSAGKLIHPARVALTGRTQGPGLFELVVVLGKERVVGRLEKAKQLAT